MKYWIVLLLFLILSPLGWLIPSRRQQGQVSVRLAARQLGLGMQLSRQAWPHWVSEKAPDPCPQYHRARSKGGEGEWCYWRSASGEWLDRWREPCGDPVLESALAQLPEDAYKFEANTRMIALCWGERGGEAELRRIVDLLQRLA